MRSRYKVEDEACVSTSGQEVRLVIFSLLTQKVVVQLHTSPHITIEVQKML